MQHNTSEDKNIITCFVQKYSSKLNSKLQTSTILPSTNPNLSHCQTNNIQTSIINYTTSCKILVLILLSFIVLDVIHSADEENNTIISSFVQKHTSTFNSKSQMITIDPSIIF